MQKKDTVTSLLVFLSIVFIDGYRSEVVHRLRYLTVGKIKRTPGDSVYNSRKMSPLL